MALGGVSSAFGRIRTPCVARAGSARVAGCASCQLRRSIHYAHRHPRCSFRNSHRGRGVHRCLHANGFGDLWNRLNCSEGGNFGPPCLPVMTTLAWGGVAAAACAMTHSSSATFSDALFDLRPMEANPTAMCSSQYIEDILRRTRVDACHEVVRAGAKDIGACSDNDHQRSTVKLVSRRRTTVSDVGPSNNRVISNPLLPAKGTSEEGNCLGSGRIAGLEPKWLQIRSMHMAAKSAKRK